MIEKAVIYNTIDRTGICPEDVFNKKELPLGVHTRVELTRVQMRELFDLYDRDHVQNTNKFGAKLLDILHKELSKGVDNDKIIPFNGEIPETTIPKKYYKDAGMEESIDKNQIIHAHRPYGDSEFIR